MKIHQRQITDDGLHIEGKESADALELPTDEPPVKALGPLSYSLEIGASSDGLWVTGEISLDAELRCDRCLEPFPYALHIPDFAMQMELPETETVDLTPYLREDILLALPAYPHCDWSGERVCPAALNESEGAGQLEGSGGVSDPRLPSAWSALDELKSPTRPPSPQ